MQEEHKDKAKSVIVSNTAYNIAGSIFNTILYFLLVPFMLYHLGDKLFGVWVIVPLMSTVIGLFNWSFAVVCVKYVSEFLAGKEIDRINSLFSTGTFFNITIYAVLGPLSYYLVKYLVLLMKIPPELQADAIFTWRWAVIIYCINSAFSGFQAIQTGVQRMDITNRVLVIVFSLKAAAIVFLLNAGWGIRGLIIAEGAGVFVTLIADIIIAFHLIKGLKISPWFFSRDMLKKYLDFGGKFQVARLEELGLFQTDKLFVSRFVGVASVTFYQMGFQLAAMLRGKLALLSSAIMPSISELQSKGEDNTIRNIYNRGTKYMAVMVIPAFTLLFVLCNEVLFVWLGKTYLEASIVTRLLIPTFALNLLTGIGVAASLGMDAPDILMKATVFEVIANFFLTWILVLKMGYPGAALATTIALGISSAYFIRSFHRRFRIPFESGMIRGILKTLAISIVLSLPIYFTGKYLDVFQRGRIPGLIFILAASIAYFVLYGLLTLKFSVIDETDRSFFSRYLFKIKAKMGNK